MLVSDAHGGFGGIAQFNRNLIEALNGFQEVDEVVVLPRVVTEDLRHDLQKVHYKVSSSYGLPAYLRQALAQVVVGGGYGAVFCAHINLLPVAVPVSRLLRARLVLIIHGSDAWQRPPGRLAGALAGCPDLVISVSRLTLDRFLSWAPPPAATAIVPNAIPLQGYGAGEKAPDLVARHGLAGRTVIMTMGRMAAAERAKGFDEIISLMPRLRQRVPSIVYLCVGDGNDRSRLEEKARRFGVSDSVVFTGRVPEERKRDYFRLADAYVMASHGEGFGIVVIEALACGVPVVGSTADGTREALLGGTMGAVVDPYDPGCLEMAILDAVKQPKRVHPALEQFSLAHFHRRLHDALFHAPAR